MTVTEELQQAARILGDHVGLRSSPASDARLASCLRDRCEARQLPVARYLDVLAADGHERQALLDLVTVQETSFFREQPQFDALVHDVLPATHEPVVIWSAGCATGAEPYSLAIALDEAGIGGFHIVATDISRRAIAQAAEGRYRESELRGLSPTRRHRYLRRDGNAWRISSSLRDHVTVVHHNLVGDAPPLRPGEATAVFCRNVFIYLDRGHASRCVSVFHDVLMPGGTLFLGVSETLWRGVRGFQLLRLGPAFAYRKASRSATRAAPRAPAPAAVVPTTPRRAHVDAVVHEGEAAARAGSPGDAVAAFRKAVYLDPDDPIAHLQLGFALEAHGDPGARRAFTAARAALDRCEPALVRDRLEGFDAAALRSVLDAKLEVDRCP